MAALVVAEVAFVTHPYTHGAGVTSYGDEAATQLGIDPQRVFKTLVCEVDAARPFAVAVVPVSGQLNLKALAAALKVKRVALADPTVAARATGYVVGGISPLGQRTLLPTVIDTSARRFETILVSAGRRGLDIELAPQDLAELTRAQFHPIGT